jgi:hypothetical protein
VWVVNSASAEQLFHIRTESTISEVRFENVDEFCAACRIAFLPKIMLERFDDRGWINWPITDHDYNGGYGG